MTDAKVPRNGWLRALIHAGALGHEQTKFIWQTGFDPGTIYRVDCECGKGWFVW